MTFNNKEYLTRPQVARRYGKTERTIARWECDAHMNFPAALVINRRRLFAVDALELWERAMASRKAA